MIRCVVGSIFTVVGIGLLLLGGYGTFMELFIWPVGSNNTGGIVAIDALGIISFLIGFNILDP